MKGIITAIIIGIGFFAFALLGFSLQHATLIGLVAFLVTLWTNEALPLGAVSLMPIILFPVFGILNTNAVTANYSMDSCLLLP
jgi:sodium-dependent dicarboxylate transporter 2/3/5